MARETMAELILTMTPDYRVAFAGDAAGASRESWSDDGLLGINPPSAGSGQCPQGFPESTTQRGRTFRNGDLSELAVNGCDKS
jgi:hypothetical protein